MSRRLTAASSRAAERPQAAASVEEWEGPPFHGYRPMRRAEYAHLAEVRDAPSLCAIAVDVTLIAAAIACASRWFCPWLYLPAVVLVGARQQGLMVLMHEAAHKGLLRRPWLNDLVGEVLLAWPLFVSMLAFRKNHMAHHRHLNTPHDPDWLRYRGGAIPDAAWRSPRRVAQVLRSLLFDLLAINTIEQLQRLGRLRGGAQLSSRALPSGRLLFAARLGCYAAAAAVLTAAHAWQGLLLFWLVPALTMLKMNLRLRQLAAHFAVFQGEGLRTTLTSLLGRLLLGPHHIGFHVEHHLYPAVRWWQLPALHRMLLARGDYRGDHPFRLANGYAEVIRDWSSTAAEQRRAQAQTVVEAAGRRDLPTTQV